LLLRETLAGGRGAKEGVIRTNVWNARVLFLRQAQDEDNQDAAFEFILILSLSKDEDVAEA
jgi:hypothetical protein